MKILVLQLKRIGDLILTTPALLALRKHFPEAHITLAIENGCRELLPALDYVDETLIHSRREGNAALWGKMVFAHFDVCLDFTGNDRSALFSVLSKASRRIAFRSVRGAPARSIFYNNFVDSSVREHHTVDHYLHLLRPLEIDARAEGIPLHLPDWALKKARQLLDARGLARGSIIIQPGSARSEKYWCARHWAAVIDFCNRECGRPCMLTGGRDAMEQRHISEIKDSLETPCSDLSGALDLMTLGALARDAALFLSVDSAAMHLAGAFGTPQIALFGPTNPYHWRPRHPKAVLLVPGRAEPLAEFKPEYAAGSMRGVAPGHVMGAIKSLLGQPHSTV